MTLSLDEAEPRRARLSRLIGAGDWTDPGTAYAKMYLTFGEQYGHWHWYRLSDVELAGEEEQITLGFRNGQSVDAVLLLPQTPDMDRAAMNLFQNWNYAPWDNPM